MQQQESIPLDPAKQSQQQQQQQMNSSNHNFPNFDSELQNLAEMGDDVDLPEVFWDYGDISYMNNSEEGGSITSSIPKWKINPADETAASANDNISASVNANATPSASVTVTQQSAHQENANNRNNTAANASANTNTNTNANAGQNCNPASIDIASMNNYISGFQQPLVGNLGGFNPFMLPTPATATASPNIQLPNLFAAMKPAQSQQSNGSNQQQQQILNTANVAPRMNAPNVNVNNQRNDNTNQSPGNNRQQQQQQQQQQLQSQMFGLPQAAFNPQQLAAAWQSNNNQVQNLNNYLQQQLQAQGNAQQLQQQLFSNGGLMAGNNQMLPPQQQMMQPQHQLGMQQRQQTQQTTQQPKSNPQPQAKLVNNTMQQQTQQMYQPQVLPLAQGGNQIIPQSGGRPQSGTFPNSSTSDMAQPAPVTKPARSNSRNPKSSRTQTQIPAVTTSSSNHLKAYIVSSSDTDGEHNCASATTRPQPKKSRRPTITSTKYKNQEPNQSFESMLQLADECGVKKGEEEMTEEERQLANRKRNREHARNTRARKKAYVESLKSTLDELCRERDSLVSERAGAASLLLEVQTTRTSVLLSFFALRSNFEKRRALWSSIMDESFTCVMPVTPYRSFPASEVQISKCQRTIMGVDGMMGDTASMHVLLNSIVDRSRFPTGRVQFRYTLIAEEAIVSGCQMMARWNMSTTNAVALGAKREVKKMGMLCARFNSAHKIVALELMFDVMAFMLQLKQNAGASAFSVVPNTVQTCVGPFGNSPMVMTLADRPYTIVQVNSHWEKMTGWKAEDVVGKKSCKILQGQKTEDSSIDDLMSSIRYQRPAFTVLTNYTRNGKKMFRNFINLFPLSTDSKITHYVGLTVHIEWMEGAKGQKQVDGWTEQVETVGPAPMEDLSKVAQTTDSGSLSQSGSGKPPKVSVSTNGSNDESSSNDVLQVQKEIIGDVTN